MPPWREAIFEHLHNKIVHFPIVLSLSAFLLLILARARPGFRSSAELLTWLAAATAALAVATGLAQAGAFNDEPKEWLVRVHRIWGIVTATAMVIWPIGMRLWPRRFPVAWGAVVSVLVLVSAFLGGMIAHGE